MIHTVQQGERLSEIAHAYGVDVREVLAANPQKARVQLPSGAQVFQSLAAGEDIELPATVGGFWDTAKSYSGYNKAKGAAESVIEKASGNKAAGTTFSEEEKVTGGCAAGSHYDPATQTCIRNLPKIGLSQEARERKAQEALAQAAAAQKKAEEEVATMKAQVAKSSMTRNLLIAGGAGVVLLGIGGAIWALKK